MQTMMQSEIKEQPEVLKRLYETNRQALIEIATAVRGGKITHVTFAGRGSSDHASIFGQYLLGIRGGILSGSAQPSVVTLFGSQLHWQGELLVAVSQSGCAADALAMVEQASACGAPTVAITNDPQSPLARAAKYHLFCGCTTEKSVAATKTFTASMGLCLLLTAIICNDDDLANSFMNLPVYMQKAIENCEADIARVTERFRYARDLFVMARGMCYPVALECMLKVQETCYVRSKGYSLSDFYHGPMAQLDSETPVILLAQKGAGYHDTLEMLNKLHSLSVEPLVVSEDDDILRQSPFFFRLPDTGSEFTQPFLYAAFAQCFAENLCYKKGLNPDAPRNLNKITVTR